MNDEMGRDEPEPEPYVPSLLEADLFPDDVAAWAASVDPGSAVAKPLAALDLARLSAAGRVDALVATRRHIAWLQAREHRLLARMAAQPVVPGPVGELDKEWVREEVACALRLSSAHAADLLAQASELVRLPATLELFDRGLIGEHHARSLAEATLGLDDQTATAVEKAVLGKAPDQRLAEFRRAIRRAVLTVATQAGRATPRAGADPAAGGPQPRAGRDVLDRDAAARRRRHGGADRHRRPREAGDQRRPAHRRSTPRRRGHPTGDRHPARVELW